MSERLPETIDPLHLADIQGVLKGSLPVSKLVRLADVLADDAGGVAIELFFAREGGLRTIKGHLKTALNLKCQNCLSAVEWPIDQQIKLGIVLSIEQANRLQGGYEPLLVEEDEKMPLTDLIEDELLLAIPDYPKHTYDCLADNPAVRHSNPNAEPPQQPRENPFSILANLKNTGDL